MSVNTFDEVAKHYANTRPVVSFNHAEEEDIRPLGKRRRKWERISRVSDREYVLHDTLPQGTPPAYPYVARASNHPPIIWKRKGRRERVTVRGAITIYADTSRYNFLRTWLPLGLKFDNWTRLGSHYVHAGVNRYYLPRPENTDDERDYFLTFERDEPAGDWELISREYKKPRVQVNKKKKAAAKEYIASFYEWLCATGPMLPVGNWDYNSKLRNEVRDYVTNLATDNLLKSKVLKPVPYNGAGRIIPPKLALEIMKNYNHPLRIHLACNFLTDQREDFRTVEDVKRFRSSFNRWVNKTLDFNQTIKK